MRITIIRLRLERSGSLVGGIKAIKAIGIKFQVLEDHVLIKVKDPWGKWVHGKAYFGKKYLPLLHELEELAERKEEGYGAVVSFKDYPMIHLLLISILLLLFSTNGLFTSSFCIKGVRNDLI